MTPLPAVCQIWDPLWLADFRTDCDECGCAIEPGDFRTLDDRILCSCCAESAALRVLREPGLDPHREEIAKAIVCRPLRRQVAQ